MDPVTLLTSILLGGYFVANRVAAARSARKTKEAGRKPAQANEHLEERVGGGSDRQPRNDAGGEARRVPPQHLRLSEPPAPADQVPPAPAPAGLVLPVVRDSTGRFRSKKQNAPVAA